MSPVSLEMTVILPFALCCALLFLQIAYAMLSLYPWKDGHQLSHAAWLL